MKLTLQHKNVRSTSALDTRLEEPVIYRPAS
jgi:hypothetical protein